MTQQSDTNNLTKSQSTFRRIGQPALIIAAVLYGLFFIPWLIFSGMLLLSFSPSQQPFTYLTTCAYPLFAIGSITASFVLYRKNQFQVAFVVLLLPLISICLYTISYALVWP
ncbi:MAG: hypothetical protein DHS20C20_30070 [Ardenticatenaceae bacterium]|nr:MAG: hypothetical protein DHS20C20_30070 [Ardenticatenaceae bacterium]